MQIIQAPQKSLEVSDAVAVSVHVGADGEAVEYGVLVPKIVDHTGGHWVRKFGVAPNYNRPTSGGFPKVTTPAELG